MSTAHDALVTVSDACLILALGMAARRREVEEQVREQEDES